MACTSCRLPGAPPGSLMTVLCADCGPVAALPHRSGTRGSGLAGTGTATALVGWRQPASGAGHGPTPEVQLSHYPRWRTLGLSRSAEVQGLELPVGKGPGVPCVGVLDSLEVPAVPWVLTSLLGDLRRLPGGIVAAPRLDPFACREAESGGWVRALCLATARAARVAAVAGRSEAVRTRGRRKRVCAGRCARWRLWVKADSGSHVGGRSGIHTRPPLREHSLVAPVRPSLSCALLRCVAAIAVDPSPRPCCCFPFITRHLAPLSSPLWRPRPTFSGMAPPPSPAARATRSSTKRPLSQAADDIMDVDQPVAVPVVSSTKGKGKAVVSRTMEEPIDVDDPSSWVGPPSGTGGSSSSVPLGPPPPRLKFSGAVGTALYEQKMVVLAEEAGMLVDGGGPAMSSSAVPGLSGPSGSASSVAAAPTPSRHRRRASASAPPYRAPTVSPVLDSLLDLIRGNRMEQEVFPVAPATMPLPPPSKSRRHGSRHARSSLPRKPRKFVSRAPRMTEPSAPYVCADPPTPPESQSSLSSKSHDGHDTDADDVAGDELANDGHDQRAAGDKAAGQDASGKQKDVASEGGPARGSSTALSYNLGEGPKSTDGGFLMYDDDVAHLQTPSPGAAVPLAHRGAAAGTILRGVESATGRVRAATVPGNESRSREGAARADQATAAAAAIDVEALADRTCNPRMFSAAFWMPGAHAVFSDYSGQAVPRTLPPLPRNIMPATARVQGTPVSVLAPRPPSLPPPSLPPPSLPPPSLPSQPPARRAPLVAFLPVGTAAQPPCSTPPPRGDGVDFEDLVTPGASPASAPAWSPDVSPQSPCHPSSGKRRRVSAARASRAATGSASGAASGAQAADQAATRTQDALLDALRNGFSSVRRELTRLRSEVVVVKAQAASALRRMDGLAATADDRQSHHGAVIERLSRLEASIQGLGERMPKTEDQGGPTEQSSLTLVNAIKVSDV